MGTIGVDELQSKLNLFIGKPVWAVSGGGAAGTTISISVGDKIRRDKRVANPALSEEEREYEGELCLLVMCAWRVEIEGTGIVSGSRDSDDEIMLSGPRKLIGGTITEMLVDSLLDLLVVLSGDVRLRLFCNRHMEDPNLDACYMLFIRKEEACAWEVA